MPISARKMSILQTYTPQQMVELTGVSVHTLRYYEKIGLLDPVDRAESGHRRYTEADLTRMNFLKRLRATGMPISQMQHYVALFRDGDDTMRERREMLEAHRQEVLAQIDALQDTLDLLDGKIERYQQAERADSINQCTIEREGT